MYDDDTFFGGEDESAENFFSLGPTTKHIKHVNVEKVLVISFEILHHGFSWELILL